MRVLFRNTSLCLIFALVLFLCGCSLLPEPAANITRYYDLGLPSQILSVRDGSIAVTPFHTLSGERYRMVCRKGNLLYGNDNNKWLMPPGSLLTKYFSLKFNHGEKTEKKGSVRNILSGSITAFEADAGHAVLGLQYRIKKVFGNGRKDKIINGTLLLKEKINGNTPEAFASAMSKAADKGALLILKDMDSK